MQKDKGRRENEIRKRDGDGEMPGEKWTENKNERTIEMTVIIKGGKNGIERERQREKLRKSTEWKTGRAK